MNTERGRISNLLSRTRECMAGEALAKARALKGNPCGGSCTLLDSTINKPVPTPSAVLDAKLSNCFLYQSPESGVPESVRLARVEQRTLELSRDPNDPLARFSQFRRPFIEICPPIPQWYYTAGEPKLQLKNCALPNTPDNPVLPG
jgi:hypothetical protein